jgi:hypothetical protein
MKSLREILTSRSFKREISLLLFFFAALNGIFALLLIGPAFSDPQALADCITTFIVAIIYAGLAILIRRGSGKALLAAGILFSLDTLLFFVFPPDRGVAGMILSRGLLIVIIVRYIHRQRKVAT